MTPTPTPTVDLDLDRLESAARGELGAKSLGEKLYEANDNAWPWISASDSLKVDYEKIALAFAASLTHDETANAVTLSLTSALRASEAERERLAAGDHLTDSVTHAHQRATTAEALAKEQAETIGELMGALERIANVGAVETPHGWVGKPPEIALREAKGIARYAISRTRPSGGDAETEQSQ